MAEADSADEWIGVPMRQAPLAALAAPDEGDAQRPALRRQAADLDRLAFDQGQDHHVGGPVDLHDVPLEHAVAEEAAEPD